ncbi:MAG: response regulator [Desulfovibrio sp.]|jgi:signal transduction histidine kinase/HPt (histidine-containing phosphotransfer) domain-containing protein/ActR/RegA family two-component response regulator|nr:response regulator [Desulfovibrio sp.]
MNIKIILHNIEKLFFLLVTVIFLTVSVYYVVSKNINTHLSDNIKEVMRVATFTVNRMTKILTKDFSAITLMLQDKIKNVDSQENLKTYLDHVNTVYNDALENSDLMAATVYMQLYDEIILPSRAQQKDMYMQDKRAWYANAVDNPDSIVTTGPYLAATTKKLVLTLSRALYNSQGKFCGVAAGDIPMTFLTDFVQGLYADKGGYGVLLSPDNAILVYPDSKYLGWPYREVGKSSQPLVERFTHSSLFSAGGRAGSENPPPLSAVSPDGVRFIAFFARLANGCILGVCVPESAYSGAARQVAFIVAAIGLLIYIACVWLVLRLSAQKLSADSQNKSKSLFLARMSHEIRTPLNAILGSAELISRKNIPAEIRSFSYIISHSGKALLALINDILDFSKIESGSLELDIRPYDFASMLNDVLNMTRVRLMSKPQLTFTAHVNPSIPAFLTGDEARVRQILLNLLTNAFKYTQKGFIRFSVELKSRRDDAVELCFQVKDTGIGIKKEDMDAIFDDFARSDVRQHADVEGTGLGLAITRTLCGMMDGAIRVQSTYQKGSLFTARIWQRFSDTEPLAAIGPECAPRMLIYHDNPLEMVSLLRAIKDLSIPKPYIAPNLHDFVTALDLDEYDFAFIPVAHAWRFDVRGEGARRTRLAFITKLGEVPEVEEAEILLQPITCVNIANLLRGDKRTEHNARSSDITFTAPSANILVVDDMHTNLLVARELIAHFGIVPDTCVNGREAVNAIVAKHYDVVFMDHMMPVMDGIEATRIVRNMARQNENCRGVAIVALTANALVGQGAMFLQKGFDDFLPKPIEMRKLAEMLKKFIPEEKLKAACLLPPQQSGGIRSIKGVNCADGLENVCGSLPAYIDILRVFCRDSDDLLARLKKAVKEEDSPECALVAHSLKSSCRTIGAAAAARLAADMEDAAEVADFSFLRESIGKLDGSLRRLVADILDALPDNGAVRESAGEIINTGSFAGLELDTLRQALAAMDLQAINRLLQKYAALPLPEKLRKPLEEIEDCITVFEYEKAIEKIDALKNGPAGAARE